MRLTVNVVNVVNVVQLPQLGLQPSPAMTSEVQLRNEPNNPFPFNPQSLTAIWQKRREQAASPEKTISQTKFLMRNQKVSSGFRRSFSASDLHSAPSPENIT